MHVAAQPVPPGPAPQGTGAVRGAAGHRGAGVAAPAGTDGTDGVRPRRGSTVLTMTGPAGGGEPRGVRRRTPARSRRVTGHRQGRTMKKLVIASAAMGGAA